MLAKTLPFAVARWGRWWLAIRPGTLSAAVSPVLVGSAAAAAEGHFRAGVFFAALVASTLIQIGCNLANDVFDFERGADSADRVGPPRMTQMGLLSPAQVRTAMVMAFATATAIGVYLVAIAGWPILAIGVLSILFAVLYTGGPVPLGYIGLGDASVFVFFGLLAVTGSYYLHAEELTSLAFAATIPVAFIVTAILVVNNLRDIETDRRAGKRTMAVLLGQRLSRLEYVALVLGAYVSLPVLMLAGSGPWVWLAWLSLPMGLRCVRTVVGGAAGRQLNPILKGTAQLHLVFGALLALGLLLD